jgi:hypothetical protein
VTFFIAAKGDDETVMKEGRLPKYDKE